MGHANFAGAVMFEEDLGGLWISCLMSKWLHWISTYVQLVCMCECPSGLIQSDWMFSCLFCLPKWKEKLAGQVDTEYSKPAVLEEAWRWSKWLTGSPWAPERYGFLPVKIADSWKSFIHVPRLMSIAKEKRWKTFQHIHDLGSAPVLHSSLANKLWRRLTGSTPHPKKDAKSRWGMLMFPEGLVRTIPSLGLVPNDRCKMCLQVLSLSTCPPSHGCSSNSKPLSIKWVDCQRSIYLRLEMHIYFASHHFLGSIPTNLPDLHIWRRLNAKFACSCFGQPQECLNYKPQNSSKLPVRHTRFLTSMGDSFTPFQPLRICPTGP